MVEYSSVKVPTAFISRIKELIEANPQLGYRSHSEFVIDATRRMLDEMEKEAKIRENKK